MARRTSSSLGTDHRRPAHRNGKFGPTLAGSDPPWLDVDRTLARLDQHQDNSRRDLLRADHAHWDCLPDVGQRHDAANVFRYEFNVSRESAASASFPYEVSILDL